MKLIILDRDGVINQDSPNYIKSAEEWIALPQSLEAIARLTVAQYKVVIATNQSGLGRGLFNIEALQSMHKKMNQAVSQLGGYIDAIFMCPHHPEDNCNCRKPLPGMFHEIIRRYQIENPSDIFAVGDSLRDLQAAQAAGFKPWLVLTGNGEKTQGQLELNTNIPISDNLNQMVDELLKKDNTKI